MQRIINYIDQLSFDFRPIYLARTFLAFSTLLSLLFNDPYLLLQRRNLIFPLETKVFLAKISIFHQLSHHLLFAKWMSIFILLLVIIGIFPRITSVFHWWIAYSFRVSSIVSEGGDEINSTLTLLLIPILLFDDSIFQWKEENRYKSFESSFFAKNMIFYALLLIELQMCILYFQAFYYKLYVPEWTKGIAVYYWFSDPEIALPDYLSSFIMPIVKTEIGVRLFTWGAIFLEFLLFLGIILKHTRYRIWLLGIGIGLHLSIGLFHGLWSFFFSMLGGLILYFNVIIIKKKTFGFT